MKFWDTLLFMFAKKEPRAPEIAVKNDTVLALDYSQDPSVMFLRRCAWLMDRYANDKRVRFEVVVLGGDTVLASVDVLVTNTLGLRRPLKIMTKDLAFDPHDLNRQIELLLTL